jgi:formylglycine-generating enzyme required for sulfatase activity
MEQRPDGTGGQTPQLRDLRKDYAMLSAAMSPKGLASLGLGGLAAGATLGAALLLLGGPQPHPVDLVSVTLPSGVTLQVQRGEVTLRDWAACHAEGGCTLALADPGAGPDFPATGISYLDAQEYLAWINARSGPDYRLPSKAEWYAIAAEVLPETPDPIFTEPELRWASAYLVEAPKIDRALHPTGDFSTSTAGLVDLDGNVWEWTQDCYDSDENRTDPKNCPAFVLGGVHEAILSFLVRDPASGGCAAGLPPAHLGMRLVTEGKT